MSSSRGFGSGLRRAAVWGLLWLCAGNAWAWSLRGVHRIVAQTREGQRVDLGLVEFTPSAGGSFAFKLSWLREPFEDYFLSMREFKCLNGGNEVTCRVPYPYRQPATVREGDWRWLEHSLLFMFKAPRDFGADLRNGLYFRLSLTPEGLKGLPQAIDLNHISAPPERLDVPPFEDSLCDDIEPGARWLDQLWIL